MAELHAFFRRIGRGEDISKDEVKEYLQALGLGKGLLGRAKVQGAAQLFMARFDKEPKDGGVSWDEMVRHGASLIPRDIVGRDGHIDEACARREMQKIAPGKDRVTRDEIRAYVGAKLPAIVRGNLADAIASLAIDALDEDGDQTLSWDELRGALREIDQELHAMKRAG